MTDDNSNLVDIPEDLADFKSVFLGKDEPAKVEDTGDDTPATDEDTDAAEADEDENQEGSEVEGDEPSEEPSEDEHEADEAEEESDDDEEEEEKPKDEDKGKRRKSSYQERISELTKARREAERREALLLQRLEALEAEARKPQSSAQEEVAERLPQGAPKPDALDKDGNPKYPLGEFDPNFITDLMEFTVEQKTKAIEDKRNQEVQARREAEAANALKTEWAEKLDAFEEEVPEVREHIAELVDSFQNVDPAYGEYLAMTIMQCENGPAIMEYLSQNIGEAQKIVASDPRSATLAIGRLEARLSKPARSNDDEKRNKKITESAPPPSKGTRGSSQAGTRVRPDTTDLAAFKREFLKDF